MSSVYVSTPEILFVCPTLLIGFILVNLLFCASPSWFLSIPKYMHTFRLSDFLDGCRFRKDFIFLLIACTTEASFLKDASDPPEEAIQ